MKYSMEEYKKELQKAHESTSLGSQIDKIMQPYDKLLYDGLEVGDGVTIHLWSDAHACTIVRRTKSTLWVQRDNAIRVDKNGMSESQSYRYEPDANGQIYQCRWSPKRHRFLSYGSAVSVGRHEYYDYSF